jgi:hypothetical protein
VSLGKSGTHSVAGIFRHYRTAHEAQSDDVIHYIIKNARSASLEKQARYVRRRDRYLWLELESSHILFLLA